MLESCKKRKAAAEDIEFPPLERPCFDTNSLPKRCSLDRFAISETETESMKASDSVSGDYGECSTLPNSERTETESKRGKTLSCDSTISNSINWGSYKFRESSYCTGSTSNSFRKTESLDLSSNRNSKNETGVESSAEDTTQFEFLNAEFGAGDIEHFLEKESKDILPSDEANLNSYELNSERWSVNEDGRGAIRRPTIDQEFEQFFSRFMF